MIVLLDFDLVIIQKYFELSEFNEIKSSLENKRKNVPITVKQGKLLFFFFLLINFLKDVKWVTFTEKNAEQAFDIKKI